MSQQGSRLAARRCLLVGGTGGLGLATARRFLEEGARIVLAGHEAQAGRSAEQALNADDRCRFVLVEATRPESVQQLFAETIRFLGGLDVLYHLAGASGRRYGDGPLHACTDEGWQHTLSVNLTSVFLTNRAAIRHFLSVQQPGVILNLASVLAWSPAPHFFNTCAYAAAKGGIISLSRLAAASYADRGIRVNVLAPGLIDTPMASRAVNDPAIAAYLRSKQPLAQGAGRSVDCAEAAVFLCSEESAFLTGVVLPVDGGWCVSEGQYCQ